MTSTIRPALLLAALLLAQGCTSFEITRLRNDVARAMPEAQVGPGYAVALGPASLGVGRGVLPASLDSTAIGRSLRHVEHVQAGFYALRGTLDADRLEASGALRRYQGAEWSPVIRVREDSTAVWILARERGSALRELVLVVLDPEGLTLARLRGDLDAVVRDALATADARRWARAQG